MPRGIRTSAWKALHFITCIIIPLASFLTIDVSGLEECDQISQTRGAIPANGTCDCGNVGIMSDLDISFCDQPPCEFYHGDEIAISYAYVSGFFALCISRMKGWERAEHGLNASNVDLPKLDLDLNLLDVETGGVENIRHSSSSSAVLAGKRYESFTRIVFNSTGPDGKLLHLEVKRSFKDQAICLRVSVIVNSFPRPSPPTTAPTAPTSPSPPETTTLLLPESTTSDSPCPPFLCPGEGIFPDNCDCAKYHTCLRFINGTFWDQVLTCPEGTLWCQDILNCAFSCTNPC